MSCRRGVPDRCSYLNSLAEKVRELWERCANAIKSINGINPDGANNFDILPGAGIQVNPRANGIEIVATGAAPEGMIETINDIGPDENSNFSISAGSGIQINEGENGIEIENISEGAVYTGVSPIEVNADNEISLKDWEFYDSTDWSIFKDANGRTTEELLIIIRSEYRTQGIAYIPKGILADLVAIQLTNNRTTSYMTGIFYLKLENSATISITSETVIVGYESGSGYMRTYTSTSLNTVTNDFNKATTETASLNGIYLYRRG